MAIKVDAYCEHLPKSHLGSAYHATIEVNVDNIEAIKKGMEGTCLSADYGRPGNLPGNLRCDHLCRLVQFTREATDSSRIFVWDDANYAGRISPFPPIEPPSESPNSH